MNINDMPDGAGHDPWLWNDSLYHEEDNPRFKSLDDYDKYDEREFEKRMLKIKKEEVRKEAIRRLQEGI